MVCVCVCVCVHSALHETCPRAVFDTVLDSELGAVFAAVDCARKVPASACKRIRGVFERATSRFGSESHGARLFVLESHSV